MRVTRNSSCVYLKTDMHFLQMHKLHEAFSLFCHIRLRNVPHGSVGMALQLFSAILFPEAWVYSVCLFL